MASLQSLAFVTRSQKDQSSTRPESLELDWLSEYG